MFFNIIPVVIKTSINQKNFFEVKKTAQKI